MRQMLATPVEFGDARLAPTTELAGLAELSALADNDDRLEAIVRIAEAIELEDGVRRIVAEQRVAARNGLLVLPKRGR